MAQARKQYRYSDTNTYTDNLTLKQADKFLKQQNGGTITLMEPLPPPKEQFYILTTYRTTYTKYVVSGKTREEANQQDGEYVGFVDGETEGHELSEPFKTAQDARDSDDGYVEGR